MTRDDQPTATHTPAGTPTRTFAPVSRSEFLATLTRGAEHPPPADATFRFGPGNVLAKRYRIVAPLGRGGMGEVYRADDLTLGQSVALKFLPPHVADNPLTLNRFRKEVAAARQVAHPHVCRVFDIGEADGQVFLSMEFIPGDDLSGVLRRTGRLNSELAIDLARQIAQGLHAIHDEELVHRDLKPANVLIDGRGRARIADFGLAATAESVAGLDAYAGTPAYQAPEQLSGGAISKRTDVYALGVLAYELLTGQRPFATTDRKQLIRVQQTEKPAPPSTFDPSIPPEVDRIVLKCLAADQKDRPASAHEVWRTLPGDAALNAALAAGITPSAEVVADAGGEGRLTRRVALLLAAVSLLFVVLVGLMQYTTYQQGHDQELKPAELRERCQTLLKDSGHPTDIPFSASGYFLSLVVKDWRDRHDRDLDRLNPAAAERFGVGTYFHRISPTPIIPSMPMISQPIVTPHDPAFGTTGSAVVAIDTRGRLIHLKRLPPGERATSKAPPDWSVWFRAAGFDLADLTPASPERVWTAPHDARYAWAGVYPERPSIPVRIEAATDRGELVGFRVVAPWSNPEFDDAVTLEMNRWYWVWWVLVPLLVYLIGGWLAYRNVRSGTADVRGTVRFALAFSAVHAVLYVLFIGRLDLSGEEFSTWFGAAGRVVLNAARLAIAYLALEPFVRRRWPRLLVGWRRLLDGRWRDPWVGRDVLIGTAFGGLAAVVYHLFGVLPGVVGRPPELPIQTQMLHARPFHFLVQYLLASADTSLVILFVLFGLSRLLRTAWLWVPAVLAVVVFGALGFIEGTANPAIRFWLAPTLAVILLVLLLRYGQLAQVFGWIAASVVVSYPHLYGLGTWFWPAAALPWAVMLTLVGYGLVVSVGGWRRLVRADTAG